MYVYELRDVADAVIDSEDEYRPYSKLKSRFLVHATTEDRLDGIRIAGLLPRGLSGCYVWSDERIPMDVDIDEVLVCRENHVYFWDDLQEGLGQSIATVGYLMEGNPAIVIADISGYEDDLKYDIEVHRYGEPDPSEPVAYMLPHSVPPEKVLCVCRLGDEYKPDMGKVACPIMHEKGECIRYDVESLYDEFIYDYDKWICECRENIRKVTE